MGNFTPLKKTELTDELLMQYVDGELDNYKAHQVKLHIDKDLKLIGYSKSVKNLVLHQAKLARQSALDALVCSPHEVNDVRKIFKKEIITPGVQIGKKNYDQKRSMEAKKVKSDWLVIGRAITQGNIKKNIQKLIQELR